MLRASEIGGFPGALSVDFVGVFGTPNFGHGKGCSWRIARRRKKLPLRLSLSQLRQCITSHLERAHTAVGATCERRVLVANDDRRRDKMRKFTYVYELLRVGSLTRAWPYTGASDFRPVSALFVARPRTNPRSPKGGAHPSAKAQQAKLELRPRPKVEQRMACSGSAKGVGVFERSTSGAGWGSSPPLPSRRPRGNFGYFKKNQDRNSRKPNFGAQSIGSNRTSQRPLFN